MSDLDECNPHGFRGRAKVGVGMDGVATITGVLVLRRAEAAANS